MYLNSTISETFLCRTNHGLRDSREPKHSLEGVDGIKVLLLDPALKSNAGHHITAARRLILATQRIGAKTNILCSVRVRKQIREEFSAIPVFSTDVYRRKTYGRKSFEKATNKILRDLLRWCNPLHFDTDIILIPTCDQVLAMALGRYLAMAPTRNRPGVMAWLLLPPDFLSSRAEPSPELIQAAEQEARQGFFSLRAALGDTGTLRLLCETVPMAERYSGLLDYSVSVAPSPNMADLALEMRKSQLRNTRLRIRMMGKPSIGKGYEILPYAIRRAQQAGVDADFFIHAAGAARHPAYERVLRFLDDLSDRVTVCDRDLGDDEYYRILTEADILLIPYDGSIYQNRGSGIFGEAETLGVPTIVVEGCEFASDAISEGRSIAAAEFSGDALAQAIVYTMRHFDELSQRAQSRATSLRQTISRSPETMIQHLASAGVRASETSSSMYSAHSSRPGGIPHAVRVTSLHFRSKFTGFLHSLTKARVWQRHLEDIGIRTSALERGATKRRIKKRIKRKIKKGTYISDLYSDSAWDVDVADPPRIKYVIAAMHRSGSNLMTRQLFGNDVGLPAEYFNYRVAGPLLKRFGFDGFGDIGYVDKLLRSRCSADLIWGCKLHWAHFEALSAATIDRIFDGTRVILTRRRDLAAQTLSLAHAKRSGRWDPRGAPAPERDASLRVDDMDALRSIAKSLVAEEQAWLNFLHARQLPALTVWYEDYVAEHSGVHRQIFDFLGVDRPVPGKEPPPAGKTGQSRQDKVLLKRLRGVLQDIEAQRP